MNLHGKLLKYIFLSVFFGMEPYLHGIFNTGYICMATCALFHWPLSFTAHFLKYKIIDSCGVTDCALGMVIAGEIK